MGHVIHVQNMLAVLREHGLKAKCAKWAWACQKVHFCDFDIDKDGVHTQGHKPHAVMDWPQLQNSKDVTGIIGLTSSYRKFIDHWVHIASVSNTSGPSLWVPGPGRNRTVAQLAVWVVDTPVLPIQVRYDGNLLNVRIRCVVCGLSSGSICRLI